MSPRKFLHPLLILTANAPLTLRAGAQEPPPVDPPSTITAPPEEAPPDSPPARDAEPPPEAPSSELTPPRLLQEAPPETPADEPEHPEPIVVTVRLTIGADGTPSAAEIVESGGEPYDGAAESAALACRFEPARRGGEPIVSRILHRVTFGPKPAPDAGEAAAGAGVASATTQEATPVDVAPPSATAKAQRRPSAVDVDVRGQQKEAERLTRSAEAVTVVDLSKAKERSSDMGEVLARTPGVVIRRSGGLGSDTRFSLNGLYGEGVPIFVDGIPLWMSGFPENVSTISINMVERVEIYRGVVPLRLSADALGGAVNFVTDRAYESQVAASFQYGAFETGRFAGSAQYRHESGFVARVSGYYDTTRNNYNVDVEVPDDRGRLHPATVPRFHDNFKGYGIFVEAGVVEKPWAKRLILKGFQSGFDKDLQHNTIMTVPYGEVQYGGSSTGAHLFYEVAPSKETLIDVVGSYSHNDNWFRDVSQWVYDWYGQRVRERRVPGEISGEPMDQTIWQDGGFARARFDWRFAPNSKLLVSSSPIYANQTGDERIQIDPDARDPLTAKRQLLRITSGVGHEWNLFPTAKGKTIDPEKRMDRDYRFQNIFNVKNYYYFTSVEELIPGGIFRARERDNVYFGIGDGLRYGFTDFLYLKASYEYATRLPNPYETFGDGFLVYANLELEPEVSHNANFGPLLDWEKTKTGGWVGSINGFLRDTDRMIVLLGNDRFFKYQNVYRAVSAGVEGALSWTSPRKYVTTDLSSTYIDQRNQSDSGPFEDFKGDRIPNRPWFLASWAVRGRIEGIATKRDTIEPFYQGRYTHEFFRGWESQGQIEYKQKVPSQTSHDIGITYAYPADHFKATFTFEIHNLTDEKLYDNFGVQRPGRGWAMKLAVNAF